MMEPDVGITFSTPASSAMRTISLEIVEIDAAGGLQPEAVTGARPGHRLILGAARQASHGEELDRTAAHVLEQGDGGVDGHNAVRLLAAQGTGGDLHHPRGAGGETRPFTRVSDWPSSARLAPTPVNSLVDVLGLELAGQLGHHGGLARIACPSPMERALSISLA